MIGWFFAFIVLFSLAYTFFPCMLNMDSYLPGESFGGRLFRMGAFATATMVTLGFANINANPMNHIGIFVVSCNLLVGYFMLAVLVTRLAVLFQILGPGLVVKKPSNTHSHAAGYILRVGVFCMFVMLVGLLMETCAPG